MSILKGIDVSYANGNINWKSAKSQIDFAIIRSSFGSESPNQIDNQYENNCKGCERYNIPYGIYHFAYFTDRKSAIAESNFAIKTAFKHKGNIKFIALDIEEDTLRYARTVGVNHTKESITECAIAFLENVKKSGYKPVLYTNWNFIYNYYDMDKMKKYPIWIAYPNNPTSDYDGCAMWQYSWTGRIHGISGNVDLNFMYDISLLDDTLNIGNSNNTTNTTDIKVGDIVEVLNPVIYDTDKEFKAYEQCYDVIEVVGDRAVIGKHGQVTAAINVKNLQKYNYKTYYIVQTGDTLTSIASKYNTTVTNLIKLNPQIKNPDLIYTGDKILVK